MHFKDFDDKAIDNQRIPIHPWVCVHFNSKHFCLSLFGSLWDCHFKMHFILISQENRDKEAPASFGKEN